MNQVKQWFRNWISPRATPEEMRDSYLKQAIQCKSNKQWQDAGQWFVQAGQTCQYMTDWTNAAHCFELAQSWQEAIAAWQRVYEIRQQQGESYGAANALVQMAEVMLKFRSTQESLVPLQQVIDRFQEAAQLFAEGQAPTTSLVYYQRAADLLFYHRQFGEALQHFSQILFRWQDSNQNLSILGNVFFKACLCQLILFPLEQVQAFAERYTNPYYQYEQTLVHQIIQDPTNPETWAHLATVYRHDLKLVAILAHTRDRLTQIQGEIDLS